MGNELDNNTIYSKVFTWMFLGLLTFETGYYVSTNTNLLFNIYNSGIHYLLYILEFVVVIVLTSRINKLEITTARILFLVYSFITGLTFSSLFFVYSVQSIMYVFLVAAILFLLFAFLGKTATIDLSKIGSVLIMILLGLVLVSVVNMFVGSTALETGLAYLFIIVFLGITAYDMQKVKQYAQVFDEDKAAIMGALQLYLDFINIFVELLRLFGKNRD